MLVFLLIAAVVVLVYIVDHLIDDELDASRARLERRMRGESHVIDTYQDL